jgi:hypothetical protein
MGIKFFELNKEQALELREKLDSYLDVDNICNADNCVAIISLNYERELSEDKEKIAE